MGPGVGGIVVGEDVGEGKDEGEGTTVVAGAAVMTLVAAGVAVRGGSSAHEARVNDKITVNNNVCFKVIAPSASDCLARAVTDQRDLTGAPCDFLA